MSSDGYFDGDELNSAALEELDAIEAALLSPASHEAPRVQPNKPATLTKEDSFCDLTFDIDEKDLLRLDNFIEDTYQGKTLPVAGPSNLFKTTSKGTIQTTLFGDALPPQASSGKPRPPIQRTKSTPRNPFGQQAPKTKQWDQTAFAKTGLKRGKSKGKGKASFDEGDDVEEDEVEFEQFPAPFVSIGPPPPMKLSPDLLEAKHWIFPLNQPKRDYQFNIVKHCLFDNTLVALPTGLGKTFIAGVVMLNFYRWFPDGKVVFVAPTKPLVAQQIDACHRTCGIPGSDAIELTGQNPRAMRARAWKEKKIFYMTPQTLVNDLTTENCDARDIVLLVIDEAHKGTGDYAYAQVIRFLMAKNPHFRVLALTATPGSNPDAVQALIDALHISRIEIRDENSLDLKAYIHHKRIEQHIIKMSEDINKVKELLGKFMDSVIKPLRERGILYGSGSTVNMHSYAPQACMATLQKDQKWAYAPLAKLSSLARAMGYLIEGTMGMCYNYLEEISREKDEDDVDGPGKKAAAKTKKLRSEPMFQAVMREIEMQRNKGFALHPKMDRLKALAVQHFAEKLVDEGEVIDTGDGKEGQAEGEETKVMVFVTFRECVDEIVEALNFERPLIRATKFVGQGTDKQGKKGMAQREQLEVIKKFKAGEFNVLVATSIGEEGLDIGEVDLIVCYDAQKTPIRMLQRLGRTGRKREGCVHVLLSEGREEFNLDKAKDTYKEVQKSILRGEQFELYADVDRMLPDHIKPECLEKQMEIEEYVREDGRKKGTLAANKEDSPQKGAKRKRNDDVGRNIPVGASTGFVSVAELLVKGSKKRKKAPSAKDFELAGQDDDTDMEIESGIVTGPPRRTVSTSASTTSGPPKAKTTLRKAATIDGKKMSTKKKRKGKVSPVDPISSQFSQKGVDDSDDMEIEQGTILPQSRSTLQQLPPSRPRDRSRSPVYLSSSPAIPTPAKFIDLAGSDSDHPSLTWLDHQQPWASPRRGVDHEGESMAWLVDDDEDPDIEIVNSSPFLNNHRRSAVQPSIDDESIEFVEPIPTPISPGQPNDHPGQRNHPGRSLIPDSPRRWPSDQEESIEFIIQNSVPSPNQAVLTPQTSPTWHFSSSPSPRARSNLCRPTMPPPELPARFSTSSPTMGYHYPEPSFPVRPLGRQSRHRVATIVDLESPILDMPPPSQRRLHRQRELSPIPHRNRSKKKMPTIPRPLNPLLDIAAIHSGDEVSEGSSHSEEEIESESDRLFLREYTETQVSPSYDQNMAYRQSLLTQAPAKPRVPVFANRPARRGAFGGGMGLSSRQRPLVSSSPPREGDDEYQFGSFVVDDEAEISYIGNSSNEL